jgi:hypothetical protein
VIQDQLVLLVQTLQFLVQQDQQVTQDPQVLLAPILQFLVLRDPQVLLAPILQYLDPQVQPVQQV